MLYKMEIVFHVKLLAKLVLIIAQPHAYHAMETLSFQIHNVKYVRLLQIV